MFPIKDTVRAQNFPVVTAALIAANVLVFLIQIRLSPEVLETFVYRLGVVPARLLAEPFPTEWLTLFTSQFVHGGWLHLISNLWALFVFGDNVEDRLGPWRFLAFYLVCGVAASLMHVWFAPESMVPAVGASGAISGVLAAYVVLFPTAYIFTLVLIVIIPLFLKVPALVWIGVWFASQLLSGLLSLGSGAEALGGIAWWAHVGGFLAGLVLVWPLLRRPQPRYHADQYWPW